MDKSCKARMLAQLEEILSPANRWFAGEYYGRPATDNELVFYYVLHGGAESFAKREEEYNLLFTGELVSASH